MMCDHCDRKAVRFYTYTWALNLGFRNPHVLICKCVKHAYTPPLDDGYVEYPTLEAAQLIITKEAL